MKASVYIDKIINGEFRKEKKGAKITFEIENSFKTLLDGFSRNICWFLGQTAYKLISPLKDLARPNDELGKKKDIHEVLLESKLFSGGIEPRLVEGLL